MAADGNAVEALEFPPHAIDTEDVSRPRASNRIAAEHARELRWRMDNPLVAGITAESNWGAQLDRMEAFGYGAIPCRRCGGRWRARRRASDGTEVFTEWRMGTRLEPAPRYFPGRQTYAQALATYRTRMKREHRIEILSDGGTDEQRAALVSEAFEKRGAALMTEAEFRDCFPELPEEFCQPCTGCGGLGVVPRRGAHAGEEVTVWPTGNSKPLGGGKRPETMLAVSDVALVRYQTVEGWLAAVAGVSVLHRVVIELYYTPKDRHRLSLRLNGDGKGDVDGIEALKPLTDAAGELGPFRHYGQARARIAQELVPDSPTWLGKAQWKARLTRQADELYGAACETFNVVAPKVTEPEPHEGSDPEDFC